MRGKRYNAHCCFDYGNSEDTLTAGKDYGCGAMEAIYFGDSKWVPHSPWTAPDGNRGQGSGSGIGDIGRTDARHHGTLCDGITLL